MINQDKLNSYFGRVWRERDRSIGQFSYTGWDLANKVNPGETVIDVGCGANPFKGKVPNLIGIDPAFPEADFQQTLEDYCASTPKQNFDVAFILGSINFGDRTYIEQQVGLVVDHLLKDNGVRVYWRNNPGRRDHGNIECEEIPFYDWTFDEHLRIAKIFKFEVIFLAWDNKDRIYAEWVKSQV
jgi:hypothetical protein